MMVNGHHSRPCRISPREHLIFSAMCLVTPLIHRLCHGGLKSAPLNRRLLTLVFQKHGGGYGDSRYSIFWVYLFLWGVF